MTYAIREVAAGLGFPEGPVALRDGRVLVVDVAGGWILAIDPATGEVSRHVFTGGGPNGLAPGPDGCLYVCNNGGLSFSIGEDGMLSPMGGDRPPAHPTIPGIQKVSPDGKVEQLYSECDGGALAAPNDLVFDRHGGFYFTDLGNAGVRSTDLGGLYYASTDGKSIRELIHEVSPAIPLTMPNGVCLSPDGDMVYAAETPGARLWGWAVTGPGRIGPATGSQSLNGGRLLFGYEDYTLFDSMAVDGEGYICVATLLKGGLTVIRPDGGFEAFIPLPEHDPFVTNICFGGPDLRTAYVTGGGRGKLWAIDWPRKGLDVHWAM
jgi:gluconolactonase